ncbi:TonB-dependent receptor [Litorimonas haliclonae]|uniref:TonB-dependent receptor n=1 Tax=Litorimonas haliclonae TaxID=2081977 RepID=UPI0039F0DC01
MCFNRTSVLKFTASSFILTTLLGNNFAFAQENLNANENENKDEVIVTARKKAESLQDVPLSVSSFSDELIQEANIFDSSELSDFTPGFQQQQSFGRDGDRPIIRGTSNILISEGKVGIFIDGVPFIGDSSALDFDGFQRIEVIRGPQSAIYGRGTLSGAINYATRPPSDERGGRIKLTAAEHDQYEIYGSLSGPITDNLKGFVSGKYYTLGGDRENSVTGDSLGQETISLNAGFNFTPTDNLDFGLRYIYSEDDDDHFPIALQDSSFNNCLQGGSRGYFCGTVDVPDVYTLATPELVDAGLQRKTHRLIGTADYNFENGMTLSGLFGFTDLNERSGVDQSYNASAPLFITSPFVCNAFIPDCLFGASGFYGDSGSDRQALSGELRLSSAQDQRFRWQFGGFVFNDERKGTDYALTQTEFGYDLISETDETNNYAVFGGVEYDVTEKLTGGVELRYASDKIQTRQGASYVLGDFFPDAANPSRVIAGEGTDRSATFESVLPRFTLDYQANNDLLFYGVVSKGNSPGGFNGVDAPATTYDEETLWNYEVGMKSQVNNLRFNLTGYYIDYSDQVLSSTFTTGPGGVNSFSDNVGDTEIFGLELDTQIDLSDSFSLLGTYALTDAQFKEGLSADQAYLFGGVGCQGVDLVNNDVTLPVGTIIGDGSALNVATSCAEFGDIGGQQAPLVSKHQLTLSADYQNDLGNTGMDWFARGDFIYRSSFFAQVHNLAESGDSSRFNFSTGVKNDNYTIRLWVKNAFQNEDVAGIIRYVDFAAPELNGDRQRAFGITPGSRRQFGATVSANF